MQGKTVLVTGATGGIGFFTARELAMKGARIFVTGRDEVRGERAVEQIRSAAHHEDVVFLPADHALMRENLRLARRIVELSDRLDVLVNNVGALPPSRVETSEGCETTLAVNAVGPFALTAALLDLLQTTDGARVVNVVSSAHAMWHRDPFDDLQAVTRYVGIEIHARAKLVALLWTLAAARRPEFRSIAVNATNPGMAWTPGTRALRREAVPFWRFVWPVVRVIQRFASARNAACSSIALATSPAFAGVSGLYLESDCKLATPSRLARDVDDQDQAWRVLSDLVATLS